MRISENVRLEQRGEAEVSKSEARGLVEELAEVFVEASEVEVLVEAWSVEDVASLLEPSTASAESEMIGGRYSPDALGS